MFRSKLATSIILLVVFPVVSQSQNEKPDLEQDNIRQCFTMYKEADLKRDGKQAALLVSENTIQYYSQAKDLALKAPEREVKHLPMLDRFTVLMLRHYNTMESLQRMTPEDVFGFSFTQGLGILNTNLKDMEIGRVEVEGLRATAEPIAGGRIGPYRLQFVKEEGKWKIDLANLIAKINEDLKIVYKGKEDEADITLIKSIELISNKKASANLWQPLIH